MSRLVVVELDPSSARPSDYFRDRCREEYEALFPDYAEIQAHIDRHGFPPIAGGASFSDYLELKVLDHIFNDGTFAVPTTVALALCTTAPTDASTGANIVEANYTTYARVSIAAADMNAASAGSKTNGNALTFPACTAGGSTVIAWATCDSATIGAGNMLVWGTATSTVISPTQTPPTVAVGALVVNLD